MSRAKISQLDNGVQLILVPMKENPTITAIAFTRTGSVDEEATQSGISHFLEHMMFKGTRDMDNKELMRYLDGLGAETNAFTWYDFTAYYVKGAVRHTSKLLDTLARVYQDPVFPEEHIAIEKGVVLGEIDMYEDMPTRKIIEVWFDLLYGDTSMGRPVIGSKKTVKAVTQNDLQEYHASNYVGKKTTVVIAGGFDPRQVKQQLAELWGSLATGSADKRSRKPVDSKERLKIERRKSDQAHLVLGVPTVTYGHQDYAALWVLATVLGAGMSSRLFERLREDMGAGYYVRCEHEMLQQGGYLAVRTGTDPKRVPEVVEAIIDEFNRVQQELVPKQELKKSKEYLLGNFRMGLETSDAMVQHYGFQAMYPHVPIETPQQVIKEIQAVTAEDIQRVAKKYLKQDQLRLAALGYKLSEPPLRKLLGL